MKTLIVVADTHGNLKGIEKLRPIIDENDYLIHLGDGAGDVRALFSSFPDKVYAVKGNCDYVSPFPEEGELFIEGVKLFYTHGHKYGVKGDLSRLAYEARSRDCTVALYGHTHTADIREMGGVTLINPGSLKAPHGEGGSYCYLVINKEKVTPVIVGQSVF